jgi:uncharacterized membrane protein
MQKIFGYLGSAVAAGFFVLLPVVIVVLVLIEVVEILTGLVAPLSEMLPVDELGGVAVATIVAIVLVLLALMCVGMLMKSKLGHAIWHAVEAKVFQPLPGYTLIKSLTQRFAGESLDKTFAPAVVTLNEGVETVAFIVETYDDGSCTVMVPFAPTPTIGNIYHLSADKVREVDASMGYAVNTVMQWGIDSRELFEKR